ncbi:inverse autotransporter beta domain-containing protein [Enterobacteriaceae endosymbiont of Donacia semicuprea]|uniref:inverse autotransporter beta domain-containing protein n=1 Tax=Enterobacteriaceae endosymbiont of Donacia semicuprea TaxID=2675783 RepID=UPI001B3AA46B|nr:inverse autotransporter beta domain-containing protein [Enterobacteriaceae endosymbiont of Donacia semicuprea]
MNKKNKHKKNLLNLNKLFIKTLKFTILTILILININYVKGFTFNRSKKYSGYFNKKYHFKKNSTSIFLLNKIIKIFVIKRTNFYTKKKNYLILIKNNLFKLFLQIKKKKNIEDKEDKIFNHFLNKDEIMWYNLRKSYIKNGYSSKYISDLFSLPKEKENNKEKNNHFQKDLFYLLLTVKDLFSNKDFSRENLIKNIKLIFVNKINKEFNEKIKLNINKIFDFLQINGKSSIILNLDENLNLNNSEINFLFPIIENEDFIFFIQNDIHKTDDRTQNNLGLGIRKLSFDNEYMVGLNSFFDYDFTLENSRLGIGIEYWREFIKLSANSYYGLSKWWHLDSLKKNKKLNDINDDEFFMRPATGLDVKFEGYFPQIPEIKFQLEYEKYYGNIGFKKNNNGYENKKLFSPSILSFGINYNPIPLLTFSLKRIENFLGESNTQFKIGLNFVFNHSLHDQMNKEFSNLFSSVNDHRYDFVNRNNNIILEYREEFLIKIFTKKKIVGYPGSKIFLDIKVKSVNKFKNIHFNVNNNFLKNGGSIESIEPIEYVKNNYVITLPNYNFKYINKNNYKLRITASDIEGNKDFVYVRINIFPPIINKNFSTLTIFPKKILIKSEKSKIVLEARDVNNKILSDMDDVSFIVEKSSFADKHNIHISKVIEYPKGTYSANITSITPGEAFLKVKFGDKINQELSEKIDFILPSVDNMIINITNYNNNKLDESNVIVSKVDVPLNFLITVFDKYGKRFKFANIEIHRILSKDRQGHVRKDSGKLNIEDITHQKSIINDNFSFTTDINGDLKLKISDPLGIGVCSTINIMANKYVTKKINLIYTVPTSPDTVHANMYGHMVDYIFLNGIKYERPNLMSERTGDQVYHYLNEDWAKFTWDNAKEYCESRNHNLPTIEELADFNSFHTGEDLLSNYGWPIIQRYSRVWTVTSIIDRYFPEPLHYYVDFKDGHIQKAIPSNIFTVFCIRRTK